MTSTPSGSSGTISGKQSGKLIIISGPSGVGKGTLIRRVRRSGEFPLVMSVSATTRERRPTERDWVDYRFLSREEFLARRERGEFLESFEVYSGGRSTVPDRTGPRGGERKLGRLGIDVKGAEEFSNVPRRRYDLHRTARTPALEKRLRHRKTESEESLGQRLRQAEAELAKAKDYKYRIVNDRLEQAEADLTEVLRKADLPVAVVLTHRMKAHGAAGYTKNGITLFRSV